MSRISVCIATYNGEKYILAQLYSILKQLSIEDEVIISDDSSTDKTVEIIKSIRDNRIRLLLDQRFKSPVFNFENAIKHCSNDIIFLSDQDDVWMPQKVDIFLEQLRYNDLVTSDCSFINDTGEVVLSSYFSQVDAGSGVIRNLRKNTYFGCCMAFKRTLLKKALPFPKDIPMHDIWLGFVADLFYTSKFIDIPLTQYRKHSTNASIASDIISNNSIFTKIRYRWQLLKYLPILILR